MKHPKAQQNQCIQNKPTKTNADRVSYFLRAMTLWKAINANEDLKTGLKLFFIDFLRKIGRGAMKMNFYWCYINYKILQNHAELVSASV